MLLLLSIFKVIKSCLLCSYFYKTMKKQFIILLLLLNLTPLLSTSQNIGVGGDIMYNFQSEGFGAGARVNVWPNRRLSIVPQFAYYFKFNKVNEYYAGVGVEYKVWKRPKFNIYALVHGAYNSWKNYAESPMVDAQKSNWNLEAGGGITNYWCLRPFFESRYNVKFQEAHIRLGVLYVFGCKPGDGNGAGGSGRGREKKGFGSKVFKNRCAAYD